MGACSLQINATSMAPITAVQFGANRLYEGFAIKLKGGQHACARRSLQDF